MRKFILALSLMVSMSAMATPPINLGDVTNNTATATAGALATSNAVVGVGIKLLNDQQQANTQDTNVTVQGDTFKAPRIPVSTAYAPSMSPSAQCMGVATGGAQGVGFGISLGKSYESKPCNQRELARMFAQLGNTDAAFSILCSMEGAEVVTMCGVKREKVGHVTHPLTGQ